MSKESNNHNRFSQYW